MSTQEHYFENLLFAYSRGAYEICKQTDPNIEYLTNEEKASIEICAIYIIDCCGWDPRVMKDFLKGDFSVTPSSESSSQ